MRPPDLEALGVMRPLDFEARGQFAPASSQRHCSGCSIIFIKNNHQTLWSHVISRIKNSDRFCITDKYVDKKPENHIRGQGHLTHENFVLNEVGHRLDKPTTTFLQKRMTDK